MNWSRENVERWVAVWLLSHAYGCTPSDILGVKNCPDACGVDRSRWVRKTNETGAYFECRECGRFIGYELKGPNK